MGLPSNAQQNSSGTSPSVARKEADAEVLILAQWREDLWSGFLSFFLVLYFSTKKNAFVIWSCFLALWFLNMWVIILLLALIDILSWFLHFVGWKRKSQALGPAKPSLWSFHSSTFLCWCWILVFVLVWVFFVFSLKFFGDRFLPLLVTLSGASPSSASQATPRALPRGRPGTEAPERRRREKVGACVGFYMFVCMFVWSNGLTV